MDIQIKLALMIFLGIIGGKISRRFKLPNVTGYIVAGLLLGPSFLNVLSEANQPGVGLMFSIEVGDVVGI